MSFEFFRKRLRRQWWSPQFEHICRYRRSYAVSNILINQSINQSINSLFQDKPIY